MGVIIKKIELSNWFGYSGNYENNFFEFSDGVNIIVGANDIGKSKLHNAFRWILSDEIVLLINQQYQISKVNNSCIDAIFNSKTKLSLGEAGSEILGVKLTVQIVKPNGEKINRILSKELQCSKSGEEIEIKGDAIKKVFNNDNGLIRTSSDDFDGLVRQVIRPNLKNFFIVQGEGLEHLTPLKGDKLRQTINSLFSLEELDKHCVTSSSIIPSMVNLRQTVENSENKASGDRLRLIEEKAKLENEIRDIEENTLPNIKIKIEENSNKLEQYRNQARAAENSNKLNEELMQFNKTLQQFEGSITQQYRYFVDNCVNKDFWISKELDVNIESQEISKLFNNIRDYAALRRVEIEDTLSKQEQKMLYKLERDQPRPEILNEMLDDNICYVCANTLNEESKMYIKEKLIPYFKNELNKNDSELDNLNSLSEFFRKMGFYLNKYIDFDKNFVQSKLDNLAEIYKQKKHLEDKKKDFINLNEITSLNDAAKISLLEYDRAYTNLTLLDQSKIETENLLIDYKQKFGIILEKVEFNENNVAESQKLRTSRLLEEFSKDLKKVLFEIKDLAYRDFVLNLENISNEKFKKFTENNSAFLRQELKISYKLNPKNEPEFEVKVVDENGENNIQGGGASQVLRQLSLIFGLIEIAGGAVDFPFIADAPTSNMTSVLARDFFNYQLKNSKNQNILISKDLWDDELKKINSLGESILEEVRKVDNSKMTIIDRDFEKNIRVSQL